MFGSLAKFILKYSKLIVIFWIVLLLVSTPFLYKVLVNGEDVLMYDITSMEGADSEAYRGMEIINDHDYFISKEIDLVYVVEYDDSDEYGARADYELFVNTLNEKIDEKYNGEISALAKIGADAPNCLSLVTIFLPDDVSRNSAVPEIRNIANGILNGDNSEEKHLLLDNIDLTGGSALTYDIANGATQDVMKIDPFSVLLVLILIGLFFRSIISSAVPPLTIGIAYSLAMMVVVGVAAFSGVYYITTTIMLVSMLGAGCDYCIFIMARYREERKRGKTKEDALTEAITWAGESVATSGLCVIIGFGVMAFCSFSLISTMGIILAAGIIFALLAALTLIPAIINLVGDRIFFPSKIKDFGKKGKAMKGWYGKCSKAGENYFRNSAKFSIKHAFTIVAVTVILTIPLAAITVTEDTSFDMISTMPNAESRQGLDAIQAHGMGGMIMPTYVLFDVGENFAQINDDDTKTFIVNEEEVKVGKVIWDNQTEANNLFLEMIIPLDEALAPETLDENSILYKMMMAEIYMHPEDYMDIDPEDPGLFDKLAERMQYLMAYYGIVTWKCLVENAGSAENAVIIINTISPDLANLCDVIAHDGGLSDDEKAQYIDYAINVTGFNSLSASYDGHQYIRMSVIGQKQPLSDGAIKFVRSVDEACKGFVASDYCKDNYDIKSCMTTGSPAVVASISDTVESEFSFIEILVVVMIFIVLFLVMKSYFTPIRSLVTIIMSVVWTLGVTHILFGTILGEPIVWIVPIVLFVICLGLGMDYDILLTTRIREYVSKGMTNDEAIEAAVEHSGAIITICGLIMGGAFLTLVLSSSPMLQQFGFALGFAILVDALVIRTYVVPAVMHLLGEWNWVGPAFLQKKKE